MINIQAQFAQSWKNKLNAEFYKAYFQQLATFLNEEMRNHTIYPAEFLILNAFDKCSFKNVKVVIIGQDPYHGEGQANGLCFSVNDDVKIPPSLKNIFKEIKTDLGKEIPSSGNLERWAEQGVLLLNAILTVRAGEAASHRNKGWEQFTDSVIDLISKEKEHVVFLLWGNYAQKKGEIVDENKHLILKSAHPSPFSAKQFFGNKHFSQTNQYLQKCGQTEIDW